MAAGLPLPKHDLRARLVDGARREDLEVDAGDARSIRNCSWRRADVGARRAALLPAARGPARQRRRLHVRVAVRPLNAELANDLGNLVNRTLAMTEKYVGGVDPGADAASTRAARTPSCGRWRCGCGTRRRALRGLRAVARARGDLGAGARANRYVDTSGPWTLAKDPARRGELDHVMHTFLEADAVGGATGRAGDPGQGRGDPDPARASSGACERWPERVERRAPPGGKVATRRAALPPHRRGAGQEELLARWIPADESRRARRRRPHPGRASRHATTTSPSWICAWRWSPRRRRIPKANKLLKLSVDLGGETRQVVGGDRRGLLARGAHRQAGHLPRQPQAPRKIRGIESQGMILAAGDEEGSRPVRYWTVRSRRERRFADVVAFSRRY